MIQGKRAIRVRANEILLYLQANISCSVYTNSEGQDQSVDKDLRC